MARKQNEFTAETWEKAGEALAGLPPKAPKERKIAAKEGLNTIRKSILKAKENGYTLDEIVKALKDQKISVSLATFKEYWASTVETPKKRKPNRPGALKVLNQTSSN